MNYFIDVFELKKREKLLRDELYVMLMLQRSEEGTSKVDCNDAAIAVACALDSDKCPAECKDNASEEDNTDTDTVVKAGNLDVSVEGESNGRLFIGRASDLDVITLKTSEEVTISKVILERIGYSTKDNINEVRLEDENGAKIADPKPVDSKGQVKLTLKKDYKAVNGELNATIVVETYGSGATAPNEELKPGSTLGFKVVDVESTAKDTNISGKANTYTAIAYDGSKMTLVVKANKAKEYNWTAEETYEVAKFKVNTPDDSSIILRGFTFKNVDGSTTALDLRKYFDKAEVTIAGEAVKGLEANVNKNDELVVSFKDYEVAAKTKSEVVLKIALVEDFDVFPSNLTLSLEDYVAVDGKVESRVQALNDANPQTTYTPTAMTPYTFKGGKVKLSNVKLGNVDAPQDSEGILVAEGTITVPEAINMKEFTIDASGTGASFIKQMTVIVNGDETDASPVCASATSCTFKFTNVEVEKSGKVQFKIDIKNNKVNKETVTFTTFNGDRFAAAKDIVYDESGKSAKTEVSGSISFSKVTLQPARASMSNSLTKDQEFANKDSQRKSVFEGEYTAKKGEVSLNEFLITANDSGSVNTNLPKNKITFYVFIDDMNNEVADAKISCDASGCTAGDTFDKVLVEAGQTVKVKVEAEVETNNSVNTTGDMVDGSGNVISSIDLGKFEVKVWGEDANSNDNSGEGKATTAKIKVVNKGSVNISTGATKQTIIRKANDAKLAEFIVKPAKGSSSVDLEEISFTLSNALTANDLTLKVDGLEEDDASGLTYSMNREVGENGVTVLITIDDEDKADGTVTLSNLKVNGKAQSKTFTKTFVPAAVEITKQATSNGSTVFTLSVDADTDTDVANFAIFTDKYSTGAHKALVGTFEDGKTISITNEKDKAYELTKVAYLYSAETGSTVVANCYTVNTGASAGIAAATTTTVADAAACTTAGGVWAEDGYEWKQVTVTTASLPDYFKIDDVDIKVMSN